MIIDKSKLKRDYKEYPLQKIKINTPTGYTFEKPYKEDLEYLYNELNLSTKDLQEYFGLTRRIIQCLLKKYNIKKDISKRLENSKKAINRISYQEKQESIIKARKTKLERYGDENYNNRKQSAITCMERYGVYNPNQQHISKETLQIIEDKNKLETYIKDNNILNSTELSIKLGMSEPQVARYILKYDMKKLFNYSKSHIEKEVKEIVSKYYSIENNIKIPNTNLEIDIYIPELKIGIEINGNYWHGELNKDKNYHKDKSEKALENGIFIYHIFEYEWNTKREQVLNQLFNLIQINLHKIGARETEIKEVDNDIKKDFLNKNHMQGDDISSIRLGLYHNDELVSLMTFTKPRFNKKYEYELSRFCSKAGYNVIGGASKLFKYFIDNYTPESIISYSNIAHTKGNLYQMLGFLEEQSSQPNYVWFKSGKILSRYQCQKHRLVEQGYNGNSEVDIMTNLGYYRIYDCGNKVWVWNNKKYFDMKDK